MKNAFRILLVIFSITNFYAQEVFTTDYVALTVPQHYSGQIWYINSSNKQEIKEMKDLVNDKTLLKSFPNIVSNVTVYEVTAEGELKFTGIGVSAKNKTYQVIYDFTQSQTRIWTSSDGKPCSSLIGIGVRMIAKVKTKKAGINLTSPFGLTANIDKIEGSLEVRVTGISSETINGIIPTTTDLSPSSISVALQAVATIKSHIYDSDVTITPQYLAYNVRDKKAKSEELETTKIMQ
jgi:hypothetical protein